MGRVRSKVLQKRVLLGGLLEGACKGFSVKTRSLEAFLEACLASFSLPRKAKGKRLKIGDHGESFGMTCGANVKKDIVRVLLSNFMVFLALGGSYL